MARSGLDKQKISAAALAIARERGLDAVTARNLAERLGVTPMALYRHVPSLAVVVDGLLEQVLADARILDHASTTLEGFLEETFCRIHDCLVAHPSVLPLLGTAAGYGPGALAIVDTTLARFAALGHSPAVAVATFHLLLSYTIGAASVRAAMQARTEAPSADAFVKVPYARAALGVLAKLGAADTFRRGLSTLLATTLPTPVERPRPESERTAGSPRRRDGKATRGKKGAWGVDP